MSEKYENLRRNRDLANWNQRRFEQEVAEEIGVGREGSRTTKPGQSHTGGSTGNTFGSPTGKESERSGGIGSGNTNTNTGSKTRTQQRPHC